VNFVKELAVFGKWLSFVRIVNCDKVTNGARHLTTFEQFRVLACSSDMILIFESTTTKDTV
jgi:hypothetical protein